MLVAMVVLVAALALPAAATLTDIGAGLHGVSHCSLAWGDCDNDGDLDLALAGYTGSAPISNIYRNDGAGVFTDIAAALQSVLYCSLAWGDCDNDGDLDLALAGVSSGSDLIGVIYRNGGGGVFTGIGTGLEGVDYCSLAWGDYDNDGHLDLALAGSSSGGLISRVYRNDGAGVFTDIGAGLQGVWDCSLAWGDYDNDGDLDLALAGYDSGSNNRIGNIYRNDGAGVFTDIAAGLQSAQGGSLAWGDYDNDGDLDLALAGLSYETSFFSTKVYRNDGAGVFTDIAAGLPGVYRCSLAWGDYDNDGDLDLALAGWSDGGRISNIYRNSGAGVFTDIGAGLQGVSNCSVAWGDYDNDGDLDLALAGYNNSAFISKVYRNDSGGVFTDIGARLTGVSQCSLATPDSRSRVHTQAALLS